MTNIEVVKKTLQNIKTTSPVLLMADAVTVFKRMYSGPIKYVSNTEEVRELVSYYYGVKDLNHPVIIEDLCLLKEGASFLLLKLVEEATFPIILLSTYDKVSPILLSRCKSIIKFSLAEINCQFMPAYRGKEAMDEYLSEDSQIMDKFRWMRDNSPMLYYYTSQAGKLPNIDKVLSILM